ncbi:MAG: methylmalonyl-CoA epimerase [Stygiobacter sp.]|jgi:methylmalonyl-CoA/ethylmalonyl-CoA epimerase|uniref:Methylmalonyl-CoA epimerase n=1 Tax=Stygiobacter electus TaxID=3032292 RepID=A0AAE3P2R3_9BACT|nr:methylmalonyl-CoA epimerase [Stygiobacter electus]MDF1613175.1 methylmalonyl-CoA epimerase [Stygiobacter electus]
MELNHIEHIGIAVKNLDESIKYYENVLGLKCYAIEEVKDQKVKTAFFQVGQTKIELLESTDPEGPISKFIEKKGEGIHHIAFAVKNLSEALKEVETKGIQLIDKQPKKGAEGLNIAFLHPKSTGGVLTELCEKNSESK